MMELGFWARMVLAVLATWRMTHLLAREDGPGDLIFRVRAWLGQGVAAKLMDCFYCLSLWIAAPAALFVSRRAIEWIFTWLALSGGACLLERVGEEPVVTERATNPAEGEINDVLRSEAFTVTEQSRPGGDAERPTTGLRQ
ncbi:MAG: hypothetical protein WAN72_03425 [Candidatus Acidiferrales bacterium]